MAQKEKIQDKENNKDGKDSEDSGEGTRRPLWTGTINFGLVTIPIRLFSAVTEHRINFHMVSKDGGCRLRQKLYCPETKKEFNFADTARGYEIAPHQYVILDKDELKKLQPQKGEDIEIEQFIDLSEIDPIYYNKTYYVLPQPKGERLYALLLESLTSANKAGVAKMIMRDKEHLVIFRPGDGVLILETLYFADEIRSPDVPSGSSGKGNKRISKEKDLELASELIDSLTGTFDITAYKDETKEKLRKYLAGKKPKEMSDGEIEKKSAERSTNVFDITERLKASLKKKGKPSPSTAKTAAKKANKAA